MEKIHLRVGRFYGHFMEDRLYKNSIILILDTFILGGVGLIFWVLCARLYSQYQVGVTTTIISSSSLIASISLLGFDNTFTRFLAKHSSPKSLFNTGVTIVTIFSLILGILYVLLLPHLSVDLHFINKSIGQSLIFIVLVIAASLNSLTNGVFLAFRGAKDIFLANISLNIAKLAMPIVLVMFTVRGAYFSYVVAMTAGTATSFLLIYKRQKLVPSLDINRSEVLKSGGFSLLAYTGNLLQNSPQLILPVIITISLGASKSALFFLSLMASNLIYVIPTSTANSLFAEGSHDSRRLFKHIKKAAILNLLILTPILIIVEMFSRIILEIFGGKYIAAANIFRILALSVIFIAISNIAIGAMKVMKEVKTVALYNMIGVVIIVGLTIMFAKDGLIRIAEIWCFGQAVMSLMYFLSIWYMFRSRLDNLSP